MSLTHRVLVVDGEPQIHRLFAVLLGDGHRVDGATNAEAALDRIHATPYDVVLIDEELGAVSGIELLRKLRTLAPELAVLLVTSHANIKAAVEAIRLGAFDYLPKTVGASELRATVSRATDHGSLTREVHRLRTEVNKARGLGQNGWRVRGDEAAFGAGRTGCHLGRHCFDLGRVRNWQRTALAHSPSSRTTSRQAVRRLRLLGAYSIAS